MLDTKGLLRNEKFRGEVLEDGTGSTADVSRSATRPRPSMAMAAAVSLCRISRTPCHAVLPRRRQAPRGRTAHGHHRSAQREGGDDVGAPPDAAVEADRHLRPHLGHDLREGVEGGGHPVELAAPVVRHEHTGGAGADPAARSSSATSTPFTTQGRPTSSMTWRACSHVQPVPERHAGGDLVGGAISL